MQIKDPKFEISAVNINQYPKNNLPQIVLVGKSNVGKSSFINTMLNRKKLARTSSDLVKQDKLTFTTLISNSILLIYLVMAFLKCLNKNK